MVRRRLRTRDSGQTTRSKNASPFSEGDDNNGQSDGFALSFSGGQGILTVENEVLSDAVTIDRVELVIPGLSFPFDITAGVRGLRHQRHVVRRLTLTLTLDGLEELVGRRINEASWIARPQLSFEKDHLSVLVDYGPKGSRVPFSFRLLPDLRENAITAIIDEPRAYGPLPIAMPLLAVACVKEMFGIQPDGFMLPFPDPIKMALFAVMPTRGWRLPDYDDVRLFGFQMLPDRAVIDYRHPDFFDSFITPILGDGGQGEISRIRKLEENRITRDGDTLLVNGQIDEARSTYARLLDRDPDSPVVAARLAMVDVVDQNLRGTACSLALEVLAKHKDRSDLASVLVHGAALNGDATAEGEALNTFVESGNPLERLAAGLRRGQLLLRTNPGQATTALEAALAARREDRSCLSALLDARAALGDKERLQALIPRWIAVHKHASERASAYIKVGNMLLTQLEDPKGAARHFERAALSDPHNIDAAWGLAESLAQSDDVHRAIVQFERLERICREAEDKEGTARALDAIGGIWLDRKEPSLAMQRFREAIVLTPNASQLHIRLAGALIEMSRSAEAASEMEAALHRAGADCKEAWWGESALGLARLYLIDLDDPASSEAWTRKAIEFPELEADARELLLTALERQGHFEMLTSELEQGLKTLPTAASALRLAGAHRAQGDSVGALSVIEDAVQAFPESAELLDALIDESRENGDMDKLRHALITRIDSVVSADRRSVIGIEIGRIELKRGDAAEAMSWFKQALADTITSKEASEGLVKALEMLDQEARQHSDKGEYDEAYKRFGVVRRESEGKAMLTAALGEAEAALELGEFEGALQSAMIAVAGPEELKPRAAVAAARAFLAVEGPDEAIRHLEAVAHDLKHLPRAPLLVFAAQISEETLGDTKRALLLLNRVLEEDPKNEEADQMLVRLLKDSGDKVGLAEHFAGNRGKESIERMRWAIELFFANGQPTRAIDVLKQLYGQTQALEDARLLARAFKETGQLNDLLALIEKHIKESPEPDELLLEELEMLTDILESRGKVEEASNAAEKLAQYCELDGGRIARAARLAQSAGRMEKAKDLWRQAIRHDQNPTWIARLVELLSPEEDKQELASLLARIQDEETSLELSSRLKLLDAQLNIGLQDDQEEDVLDRLTEMVGLDPTNDSIWKRLRTILERRGKWELLEKRMRERLSLLEKEEDLANGAVELGQMLENKLGDEFAAQIAYDQALQFVPDHQGALKARASLAYVRRNWERLELLIGKIESENVDEQVELWRAAVAEHMGRSTEAVDLYKMLMNKDPSNADAKEGLARMGDDTDLQGKLSDAFKRLRRE